MIIPLAINTTFRLKQVFELTVQLKFIKLHYISRGFISTLLHGHE